MHYSDLHIHSCFSDGKLTPQEIVDYAISHNVKCISITDHDTINGQALAMSDSKTKGLTYVTGVELSTEFKGKEVHLLGYFIDITNENLLEVLKTVQQSRLLRAKAIIGRLNEIGVKISFDSLELKGESVGRPHIAQLLVNSNYASSIKEAFQIFLIEGKPGYVERYKLPYKEALDIIRRAGGIPVLAHPGEIYKGISIESIIKEFRVYGLKGIEVFHSAHTLVQLNNYYNLAKKYSLTITGGSDCHGSLINNELLLGTVGMNEKLTVKFLRNINEGEYK